MTIKYMNIKEFIDEGFLQEVNRTFFHPLGLALEVSSSDGYNFEISGVWDYRDDPEGILYGPDIITREKIEKVSKERTKHLNARMEIFGEGEIIQEF